jgi:hypothetical protein
VEVEIIFRLKKASASDGCFFCFGLITNKLIKIDAQSIFTHLQIFHRHIGICYLLRFYRQHFSSPSPYDPNTAVSSVLIALGEKAPEHYVGTTDMEKIGLGTGVYVVRVTTDNQVLSQKILKD